PSATLHEIRPALRQMEYLVCTTGCQALQIHRLLIEGIGHDCTDAFRERFGVKLGSDDLVRAVGKVGDAPVADEGDELLRLGGLNFCADMLGTLHTVFA